MASISEAALALTKEVFNDPDGNTKGKATYEVVISDTRADTTFLTLRVVTKVPISTAEVKENVQKVFKGLAENLGSEAALHAAGTLMEQFGFISTGSSKNILRKRTTGSVDIRYEADKSDEVNPGITAGLYTSKGKVISQNNLQFLLNVLMKEYMMKEMTSSTAGSGRNSPLRNRTGRFITSANVANVRLANLPSNKARGKQSLSLYYEYMVRPYQVFDPAVSSNSMASNLRNPRRIIGEALAKAARDLLNEKLYNITVRQL